MAFTCLQKLPVSATKQPIREITFVIDGITLGKWSEMEGSGPWLGVGSVTACWLELWICLQTKLACVFLISTIDHANHGK